MTYIIYYEKYIFRISGRYNYEISIEEKISIRLR